MFIRNLILDMGGVIVNIDFKRTADAFARLGAPNFYEIYNQRGQENFIDDFETGKISAAQFRLELRKKFNLASTVKDVEIDEAWNALFIDLPLERLELIKSLRKKFPKLFLFSNTNSLHYERFASLCPDAKTKDLQDYRTPVFTGCFDAEYYSFLLGQKKPNPAAFATICVQQGLKAEETVFIDDSIQHVLGARAAGLHAIHLDLTQGMSIMMVPQLLEALNKQLQVASSVLLYDHSNKQASSAAQPMVAETKITVPLLKAKQEKSSWCSCCSCLFGRGNKKEKTQAQAEEYQYLSIPTSRL